MKAFGIRIILFLILFGGVKFSKGQVTIWLENFTSEANGAFTGNNDNTINPANDWTTSCPTCNRPTEFRVDGNQFHVENTDETATWLSETISLVGYSNISLSVSTSETGNLENEDFIQFQYSIDGGAFTDFATNGLLINDFTNATATQTGLFGSTLVIRIFVASNETNEDLFFDNVTVSGFVANNPPLAFIIYNNEPADKVYGQPNFTTNSAGTSSIKCNNSYHTAVDRNTGKVFICEVGNHRVLRYKDIDAYTNGEPAEAVLGQTNFTNNGTGLAANRFSSPTGIHIANDGILWVADFDNSRVLRFNNASTKVSGANADGVLGQANFTSTGAATTQSRFNNPVCVFSEDDGTLWVADLNNQRVLRFNNASAKANGANADGVLGKGNFTTSGNNTAQDRTSGISGVSVNQNGRLYVSDINNHRIVWWDNAKTLANGANATGQMGQPNFTTNTNGLSSFEFSTPRMVTVTPNNKFLAVSDDDNNRILIFINPGATSGEVVADFVFGQTNFTTGTANSGGLSASSVSDPRGIYLYQTPFYENYLFVSDRGNNRTKLYVLFDIFYTTDIFTPISDTMAATEVDGDVLTFSIVDSCDLGTIVINNPNLGTYTYYPILSPVDYTDTILYSVCDKDGCDTSVIILNVLTSRRLWVKADKGILGSSVTKWQNQSNFTDSIEAYIGGAPNKINSVFNYNPAVDFNGSTQRMFKESGIVNPVVPMHSSLFYVSSPNTQKNQKILEERLTGGVLGAIDLWGTGQAIFEALGLFEHPVPWGGVIGEPYLWSMEQSSTAESLSRNGEQITTGGGGTVLGLPDTTNIGYDDAGDYYDGYIAEIINYQHSVGKTFLNHEVNSIESYLCIKYGLTLNQTNDNDNDGTLGTDYTLSDSNATAWDDAANVGYINDIAGIGRDDFFGLNQKQSKSENNDAIVTISLGSFAIDNPSNTNLFPKDTIALMWANNNGSLTTWNKTETPASSNLMYRIGREWKIEENLGDVGMVEVRVDSASLPIPSMLGNRLYVVVDEDKNGNFTNGNLRVSQMTKTAGVWKTNINFIDGEVFTFMYIQWDMMRHGKTYINLGDKLYRWINGSF